MILIDLSQVIISNLMTQVGSRTSEIDENLVRHMILTSLLNIKKKFSNEYGNVVIIIIIGEKTYSHTTNILVKKNANHLALIGVLFSIQ